MRWCLYERRSAVTTCCFCCHIRTGTICLGIYSLLYELLMIAFTLALAVNPELGARRSYDMMVYYHDYMGVHDNTTIIDNATQEPQLKNLTSDGRIVELVLNVGYAMFTVSLLYGVIKEHPKFLLPFFCLQVFEFCISCLVVVGYFTYEPNIKIWIASWKYFPLREQLLSLNTGWLMLIVGLLAIIYLWIKAYFISVVWSCYKYLIQKCMLQPTMLRSYPASEPTVEISMEYFGRNTSSSSPIVSSTVVGHNPADSQILLPPKYEDVLQMSDSEAFVASLNVLPPPYSMVTQNEQQSNATTTSNNNA